MLLGKLSEENKKLFLCLEMLLVNIDGQYSDVEKDLVVRHCKEMGIAPIEYDENSVLDDVAKSIRECTSVKEKKIMFIELLTVAVIDGVYDDKEREFMDSLRTLLGIPAEVGEQAFELVKNLVTASEAIENYVVW